MGQKRLEEHWHRRWAQHRETVLRCGEAGMGLFVVVALLWRLAGGGVFAQVSWGLAVWAPPPTSTATQAVAGQPTVPADLPPKVRAFVALALPYALQAHQMLTWQTSVILAQWGLEHGWSVPDAQGYNWGNTEYAPGCLKPGRFC